MKSYEHLSYDPIAFADEVAKLDAMIAEKVKELKQQQEEENEKEISTLATDVLKRDCGNTKPELKQPEDRGHSSCAVNAV